MNKSWFFSVSLVAALGAAPVQAAVLDAKFSGTVASQAGTSFVTGATVNGEFTYSTDLNTFLTFTVGGTSVVPGFGSSASLTPDQFSALYRAQLSPVQQGGTLNSTFTVDLEGLSPWPTTNAVALLTNAGALATNLDTITNLNDFISSTFGFATGNSDGSNVRRVTADLTSIQVSVPEPATFALLAATCIGMGFLRRRA